jgi:hypothetical protein
MKSERRHELQHNELAEWLFKAGQLVKPYQNLILAALIALMVLILGLTLWSRTAASRSAKAWSELVDSLQSGNLDALTKVAEDNVDSNVGREATVVAADMRLGQGCFERFENRAVAQLNFKAATESYSTAIQQCKNDPLLLERATFGLARAKESQCDLDAAIETYEKVIKRWPEGAYAGMAKQRLEDLKQRETKLMYDDLRNYPETGPTRSSGSEMPSPSNIGTLPDEPLDTGAVKAEPKGDTKKPEKAKPKK